MAPTCASATGRQDQPRRRVGVKVGKQRRSQDALFQLTVNRNFGDPTKPAATRCARLVSRDLFDILDPTKPAAHTVHSVEGPDPTKLAAHTVHSAEGSDFVWQILGER